MNDNLDDLLAPTPPTPGHDRVKDAVLRATTRRVTRMRWLRRGQLAVMAAVLLAVGGVAGWFAKPSPAPPPDPVVMPVPIPVFTSPEPPSPGEVLATAEEIELQAERAGEPAEAAKLYRLAGVRFEDRAEYGQAARCYRLHLLAAGPEARAVSTDDSWLLISVKSRTKENDREAKRDS